MKKHFSPTLLILLTLVLLTFSSCGNKTKCQTIIKVDSSESFSEKEFNTIKNQLEKRLATHEISTDEITANYKDGTFNIINSLKEDDTRFLNQLLTASVNITFNQIDNESLIKLPNAILAKINSIEGFQLLTPQYNKYEKIPFTFIGVSERSDPNIVSSINKLLPENFTREHRIVCDMFKNNQGYFNYYIIKKPVNKTSTFSAYSIESCEVNEQEAQANLLIKTNENNDPTWEVFTGNNVQKQIAILINNAVIFAPMINEKITENEFSISGIFNLEEAKEAASLINIGHIPYPIQIVKQEKISK